MSAHNYSMGNRGSCSKKFPLAQQEVNVVWETSVVMPPVGDTVTHPHPPPPTRCKGWARLPAMESVCLSNEGHSQRASGAELCESLLIWSQSWISLTAPWNSSLSWEAYVWHTFKAQKNKIIKPQLAAERHRGSCYIITVCFGNLVITSTETKTNISVRWNWNSCVSVTLINWLVKLQKIMQKYFWCYILQYYILQFILSNSFTP